MHVFYNSEKKHVFYVFYSKVNVFIIYVAKIGPKLLLTNDQSTSRPTRFRFVPKLMTLNER